MKRLVDADALIKRLKDMGLSYRGDIIGTIEAQACDEAEKQGHWLEKEVHTTGEDVEIDKWQTAKCSACGRYHTTPYVYYFEDYDYCPRCGAKMQTEEDQEKIFTDKEKRIFLAAITRERQICKAMDEETVREPYEATLTSVCDDIERKVKNSLWVL